MANREMTIQHSLLSAVEAKHVPGIQKGAMPSYGIAPQQLRNNRRSFEDLFTRVIPSRSKCHFRLRQPFDGLKNRGTKLYNRFSFLRSLSAKTKNDIIGKYHAAAGYERI
jgi:hypothetical protein